MAYHKGWTPRRRPGYLGPVIHHSVVLAGIWKHSRVNPGWLFHATIRISPSDEAETQQTSTFACCWQHDGTRCKRQPRCNATRQSLGHNSMVIYSLLIHLTPQAVCACVA